MLLIRSQSKSPYIVHQASERALAGRALLLGTMAACSGVGLLVGLIGTSLDVHTMRDFRLTLESKLKPNKTPQEAL